MKVKILTNQVPLRFGDIGYCSMVPVNRYTYEIDIFKVRVNGIEYELKSIDFEVVGEDDNPFEARINLKEQIGLTEKRIELANILKDASCTIFHFTDSELRRFKVFNKNGELITMPFIERTMFAHFAHEYCSECMLPYVEEVVRENYDHICFFNNLKHFRGSQFISKENLFDFLENLVRKESECES